MVKWTGQMNLQIFENLNLKNIFCKSCNSITSLLVRSFNQIPNTNELYFLSSFFIRTWDRHRVELKIQIILHLLQKKGDVRYPQCHSSEHKAANSTTIQPTDWNPKPVIPSIKKNLTTSFISATTTACRWFESVNWLFQVG